MRQRRLRLVRLRPSTTDSVSSIRQRRGGNGFKCGSFAGWISWSTISIALRTHPQAIKLRLVTRNRVRESAGFQDSQEMSPSGYEGESNEHDQQEKAAIRDCVVEPNENDSDASTRTVDASDDSGRFVGSKPL